jgi:hypothetical protein
MKDHLKEFQVALISKLWLECKQHDLTNCEFFPLGEGGGGFFMKILCKG